MMASAGAVLSEIMWLRNSMITDGSHPPHVDPDPAQTPSSTAPQPTTQQPCGSGSFGTSLLPAAGARALSTGAAQRVGGDRGQEGFGVAGAGGVVSTVVAGGSGGSRAGPGQGQHGGEADAVGVDAEVDRGAGGQVHEGVVDDEQAPDLLAGQVWALPAQPGPGDGPAESLVPGTGWSWRGHAGR